MTKTYQFSVLGDDRGSLISLESGSTIPFDVKRVYYIYDTQTGVSRGYHAHKKLEQILVCVSGSCRIVLDDGHFREDVILNSPDLGLYVGNNQWREMHDFSEDCVLLVIASACYDENDYIRDYEQFLREVK